MSDSIDRDNSIDWSDDPRLVAYVFGELATGEREEIDRALLSDPSCRTALDDIVAFLPEVEHAVRAGDAGVGLASEARASIAAAARRGPVRRRRTWAQPALAAAAALLVTTIVVSRVLDKVQPPDVSVATGDARQAETAAVDGRSRHELADKSNAPRELMTRSSAGNEKERGRPVAKRSKPAANSSKDGGRDVQLGLSTTRKARETQYDAPAGSPAGSSAEPSVEIEAELVNAARPVIDQDDGETRYEFLVATVEDRARRVEDDQDARLGRLERTLEDQEIDEVLEVEPMRQRLVRAVPENAFVLAKDDPLSTFSIDVDTASYTNVRRSIAGGRLPSPFDVRIEEFVNYFSYDDAPPTVDNEHPFAVHVEAGAAPWMPQHRLVRISLKGRAIDYGERAAANLVFLVDVSGSMSSDDKLPLVKKALAMLTETLDPLDRVAIVVYASAEGLALPSTPVAARESILQSLERLDAGGSTNGGAGIQLAYSIAAANFVDGGVNRVILCTDGDFNVGVTSEEGLEELIAEKARSGIDLTVLGFGTGNFKDAKMEALSNRGNGNFAYLDSEFEARKVLVTEVGGTLNTIAKDVKLQVVWNPSRVQAFRLIGYENRMLEHADFVDDTKDAGEIGAGHGVTALYEVVPWGVPFDIEQADGAKPDPVALDEAGGAPATGPFVTVRLRYKQPGEDTSVGFEFSATDSGDSFDGAPESLRFSAAVAAFGMILRESSHVGEATLRDARRWALESLGEDAGGLRAGFVELLEKAVALDG